MQAAGTCATSVQWGAWGGSGMAIRTPGFMERMARLGLGVVEPEVGVTVLARVLGIAWKPLRSHVNQHALFTGSVRSCTSPGWKFLPVQQTESISSTEA